MAFANGGQIVTNGLVLALDASDRNSYPGSGTVWSDMSGNGNDGTLTNGPTFSSANGGSIVFDGVNDHVTLPTGFISSLTACTLNFWFYWSDNQQWSRIFDFGTGTTFNMFFVPKNGNAYGVALNTPRFAITTTGGTTEQRITSTTTISLNTWFNFTITLSGAVGNMYRNAVLDATNASMTLTPSSLGNTNLNYLGRSQYADPYFQGRIANFQIYNRVLSTTEILQNYNATKTRFGL